MKKSKKIKLLYSLASIIMIVMIALIYSISGNNSQSFSILSADKIQIGNDGLPQWVILASADIKQSGSTYRFTRLAKDLQTTKDINGGTIKPTKSIDLTMNFNKLSCEYTLTDNGQTFIYLGDRKYSINSLVTSVGSATLSDGKKTINLKNSLIKSTSNFNDGNGGLLTVTTEGALQGANGCPELSQFTIKYDNTANKINFYRNGNLWNNNVNALIDKMTCSIKKVNDGTQNTNLLKPKLICELNSGLPTLNPIFKITADAKYLNFAYIPATVGVPKILEVIKPPKIIEGSPNAISVKVQNTGQNTGSFVLYANSNAFSFVPTATSPFVIKSGEIVEKSFTMYSPNIKLDTATFKTNDFKLCALNEFGSGNCNGLNYDLKVTGKSSFQKLIGSDGKNTCGNNFCDTNENYQTCSSDCKIPITCDGIGMSKQNNKCVCETGFTITQDGFGGDYCKKNDSNTMLIIGILATVFVIITIMIVIFKRRRL